MKTIRFCMALCGLFLLTQNLQAAIFGEIKVTILPPAAAIQGAEWQVDSGSDETNGATASASSGSHTVSFTTISGWNTPSNQVITVTNLQTNFLTATYTIAFTYTTNADNTLTITGPSNAAGAVTIPGTINGLTVTAIGTNAFQNCTNITSLVLPDSVGEIDAYAFASCSGMTNAVLGASLTNVGNFAFHAAGLSNLSIPVGVQNIGDSSFEITKIGSVVIPGTVTNIGQEAFSSGYLTNLVIGNGVRTIGTNAFNGCAFSSLVIPGSVVSIELSAFFSCDRMTNLTISNGVANIGPTAFYECDQLTTLTVPGSVTNIDSEAFGYCLALTNVTLSEGLEEIGAGAFLTDSNIDSIDIPDSVTVIGDDAFESCTGLTNVKLPQNLQNLGNAVFVNCEQLFAITIPGSVTNFGQAIFEECTNLHDVVYSSGLLVTGTNLFSGDLAITNVVLGDTITNIQEAVFASCFGLTTITIPASVTQIEPGAFAGCTNLGPLYFLGNAPDADSTAFGGVPGPGIYLAGTTGWSNYLGGLHMITLSLPTGGVQVFITPATVLTNGAFWQIDQGANMTNGAIAANLSEGEHVLTFSPVAGYVTPGFQIINVASGSNTVVTVNYTKPPGGLQVTLGPVGAITAGAQWQVNGGSLQNSGALLANVPQGTNTVAFASIPGWIAPPSQIVTVVGGQTTSETYLYVPSNTPSEGLILLTSGSGTIQTMVPPSAMIDGKKYTAKAVPNAGNLFVNWVGGINPGPFTVLSASASYSFTMASNLLLEANFATNIFTSAQGAYNGLFAPTNSDRNQTNSGAFTLNVTSAGAVSGKLNFGSTAVAVSGKINSDGASTITTARHGASTLTTTLQLADQGVTGTITDGSFVAALTGYQDAFGAKNKATNYVGKYTFIVPGTTNPAAGPFGVSYGTVTVSTTGGVSASGNLADGTPFSQSSAISADGYWPMYVSLYGGKGSLWSWNYFTNGTITNAAQGSWINGTNASKTALYRTGFTNQSFVLAGSAYSATAVPLLEMTNGQVTLDSGATFIIANEIALTTAGKIVLTNTVADTNKLSLSINKSTGAISGAFANPANPKQTIKVSGVLLQNATNAQGYFLGTNQSGTFLLAPR